MNEARKNVKVSEFGKRSTRGGGDGKEGEEEETREGGGGGRRRRQRGRGRKEVVRKEEMR